MDLNVGWREALLLAVLVLAVYAGIAMLKLSALRQPKHNMPVLVDEPELHQEFEPSVGLSGELSRLRDLEAEVEALRSDLNAVREECSALRQEVEQAKAARNVAPQYAEAISLAQNGLDAANIAEQCGISVSEAELVRALGTCAK